MARTMTLGAFLHPTGHHMASWRHPDAPRGAALDLAHYAAMAQTAERGLFDLLFLADGSAVPERPASMARANQYVAIFEPTTLLAALAPLTSHIGLVATMSTTYNEPYQVARRFASLDHLSRGRAGWNLVTTANPREAQNFGRDTHLAHGDRYGRAREFAEAVGALWDSWDDDALVEDKASGLYADPARVHAINYRGDHIAVRGPLNAARPPQGRPVIVQAGSSEAGRELAAATAEIVFTSQPTLEGAVAFYRDLKGRAERLGRDPAQLKILPGVSAVIGDTAEAAQAENARLQALIHPELALSQLGDMLGGADLSGHDVDGPLPELPPSNASQHFRDMVIGLGARGLTIRQIALRTATRGHWTLAGTASEIADALEKRFFAGAADGFNVMPPLLPSGLDVFVDKVVPELQRRGLFRTAYEGSTLRGNLGLDRPSIAPHPSRIAMMDHGEQSFLPRPQS